MGTVGHGRAGLSGGVAFGGGLSVDLGGTLAAAEDSCHSGHRVLT